MIPIGSRSYEIEMNMKYNVYLNNIEEVTDWTVEEKKWYDWLQKKLKEREDLSRALESLKEKGEAPEKSEGPDWSKITRDGLIEFVYYSLLYRNLKEPEAIDGLYRSNKVIRINKLMQQRGGLNPWNLPEIKCSGLYTVHPVWYIDPDIWDVKLIQGTDKAHYSEMGLPEILGHTGQIVKFKGTKEKAGKIYCAFLEDTNFAESIIDWKANWSPFVTFESGGGVIDGDS